MRKSIVVIGAGAAGFFGAINIAQKLPRCSVSLLEGTQQPLAKVKISGGGRCNVTHNCFEPRQLVQAYPRGSKELLAPFHRFQPQDVIDWFSKRGVKLHAEEDGRIFPISNSSQTIIDCFHSEARKAHNISIFYQQKALAVERDPSGLFKVVTPDRAMLADSVLLCTGSSQGGHNLAKRLGHSIVEPVPSLFTMKTNDPFFQEMAGTSFSDVEVSLMVMGNKRVQHFRERGPILVTHWGLSGPAILKLSAFAARCLHQSRYQATLTINFFPNRSGESIYKELLDLKGSSLSKKSIGNLSPTDKISKRTWQRLLELVEIDPNCSWQNVKNKDLLSVATNLVKLEVSVQGKSNFKEEFVTAGGIERREIDFKTMESKLIPNLFFAGEIIDIDGITGGFNFQNAWTGAWLVSETLRRRNHISQAAPAESEKETREKETQGHFKVAGGIDC